MHRVFILILLIGFFSLAKAQSVGLAPPYIDGEVLHYEAKFSKLILRGASVAELTFKTSKSPDGNNFIVNGEARSKGTLVKLFRFSFLQQLESTIDAKGTISSNITGATNKVSGFELSLKQNSIMLRKD